MASSATFDKLGFFNGVMPLNQTNWAAYFGPMIPDGVLTGIDDEMEVFANSSGMVVYVKAGECRVRSHQGVLSSQITLDIAPADLTYPRRDFIVARVTYGDPSTMEIVVKTGTPSPAPAWLEPKHIAGDVWELPLASVWVQTGAVTIDAGAVMDQRFIYSPSKVSAASFDGTAMTLYNEWEYRNNTPINSLELTFPDTPTDIWCCTVCFTSAASFSGVTFKRNGTSYSPKLQGVSLNLTSVRYNLTCFWDGAYFWVNSEAA